MKLRFDLSGKKMALESLLWKVKIAIYFAKTNKSLGNYLNVSI